MNKDDALDQPELIPSRIASRYLLVLLIVPAILALLPVPLERLGRLPNSYWSSLLDYSYQQAGTNADIVIFGDSTAIYDVDTARLSDELHKKVINLPNTAGSLPVMKDASLRAYLQANKPPSLIVFFFAPWNLDIGNQHNSYVFEGDEMLLRHEPIKNWFTYAQRHPSESLLFPLRFYSMTLTDLRSAIRPKGASVPIVLGHVPYPKSKPLGHSCTYSPLMAHPDSTTFVQTLASRYATPSTKVMVYLAPIPGCTGSVPWSRVVPASSDPASVQVLSPEGFANDDEFGHALPALTDAITDRFAEAIRKVSP